MVYFVKCVGCERDKGCISGRVFDWRIGVMRREGAIISTLQECLMGGKSAGQRQAWEEKGFYW